MRVRLVRRLHFLNKVSNATWGLECRISSAISHALVGSVFCYGLAATGAHIDTRELRKVYTTVLNRVAR